MHGLHYHHIVPVSDGGNGNTDNIILLCPNCHKMAHAGLISDDELRKHTYTKEQCERKAEEYRFRMMTKGTEFIEQTILKQL